MNQGRCGRGKKARCRSSQTPIRRRANFRSNVVGNPVVVKKSVPKRKRGDLTSSVGRGAGPASFAPLHGANDAVSFDDQGRRSPFDDWRRRRFPAAAHFSPSTQSAVAYGDESLAS